jgi:hypothetical protein
MNVKVIRFQKPSIPGMSTNFMLKCKKNPSQHFLGLIWSLRGLSKQGKGINQCGASIWLFFYKSQKIVKFFKKKLII